MNKNNLILLLVVFSFVSPLYAKPSLARMTNIQVDSSGNLYSPDEYHYKEALKFYRKDAKETALQRFLFAAEFGNKESVKFIGLMLLEGDGVDKQRMEAIAWIKMSADNGDNESIKLTREFKNLLATEEYLKVEKIYENLKDVYGKSAVLNNIYKFYRRYKFQTLDKPNTIKFEGKNVVLNEMQILRLETQVRQFYVEFKNNMGNVEQGDIIIKKD